MPAVRDAPEKRRFELFVDGSRVGVLDYDIVGHSITLVHTEIDPANRGQQLGGALVHGALDDIRGRDLSVEPACSFVQHYIARHPEYRDLLEER